MDSTTVTKPSLPRAGLPNLGNTCFANAALVSLWFTPGFLELLQASQSQSQFAHSFSNLFTDSFDAVRTILSLLTGLNDGRQHCSHSLYTQIVSKLVIRTGGTVKAHDKSDDELINEYHNSKGREEFKMFGSVCQNKYACAECGHVWQSGTCSYSVSLPIPVRYELANTTDHCQFETGFFAAELTRSISNQDYWRLLLKAQQHDYGTSTASSLQASTPPSVLTCYQYYQRVLLMTPDNTLPCTVCGGDTQHYKQTVIIHSPQILVLHFQRYDESTRGKSQMDIQFEESMDLTGVVRTMGKYSLFAVVHHGGGLHGGHYWVDIKHSGKWVEFNDSEMSATSVPSGRTAYILFYSKTD